MIILNSIQTIWWKCKIAFIIQYLAAAGKDKNYVQKMRNAKSILTVQRSVARIENYNISLNLFQEDKD